MQQLNLLPIPKQPNRREPSISSQVIRAYIKQALRDFPHRQAERERRRKIPRFCKAEVADVK